MISKTDDSGFNPGRTIHQSQRDVGRRPSAKMTVIVGRLRRLRTDESSDEDKGADPTGWLRRTCTNSASPRIGSALSGNMIQVKRGL